MGTTTPARCSPTSLCGSAALRVWARVNARKRIAVFGFQHFDKPVSELLPSSHSMFKFEREVPKLRRDGILAGHDFAIQYPGILAAVLKACAVLGANLHLAGDHVWFC